MMKRTFFLLSTIAAVILTVSMMLPVSSALWQKVLTISVDVSTAERTPTPPPQSQAGTTLAATKTAYAFIEEQGEATFYGVMGEICVANGGEFATDGLTIIDIVQVKDGAGQYLDYASQLIDVSEKPALEPGEGYCYPYRIYFDPAQGKKVKYRNRALVLIFNHAGWMPGGNHCEGPDACPFGPSPAADFAFEVGDVDEDLSEPDILPEAVTKHTPAPAADASDDGSLPTSTPDTEPEDPAPTETPATETEPTLTPLPSETEPAPTETPPDAEPAPTEDPEE